MPDNDLSEFSTADINEFKKDFTQIIKVGEYIDTHYSNAKHELDTIIPKYEKLLEKFNKKYSDIKIKTKKTLEHFKVMLFVKEKDVKDFFANSASRIHGLKSVGRINFNEIDVADAEKFSGFLDSIFDKIYLSYVDPERGTSTIAAVLNKSLEMIEILYDAAEVIRENSAGFKICMFYALRNEYDKKIDVHSDAATFGFSSVPSEMEKREWNDKFEPRFLE